MRFTTPKHPSELSQRLPSFGGAERTALRLHPRRREALPVDATKLGGAIVWPENEPPPICPEQRCPAVPVLQVRSQDAPQLLFPPNSDLMQLLWYPQSYDACGYQPKLEIRWRLLETLGDGVLEPDYVNHDDSFVVRECEVFPEEVVEYPYCDQLTREQSDAVYEDDEFADGYELLWSTCPGVKIGGYPEFAGQDSWTPQGLHDRPMTYLLTISDHEWDDSCGARWRPVEVDAPPVGRKECIEHREGDRTTTTIETVFTPEEQAELEQWTPERRRQLEASRSAIGTYLKCPLNVFLDRAGLPWGWATA